MAVEIIKYKAINKGNLLGFADIYIPGWDIEIYGCAHFRKDKSEWVTMPQKEGDINGEKKFFPILKFRTQERRDALSRAIVDAIREIQNKA